jgi:diguanylate cyclase (GGDEF)-like protein
MIHTLPADPEMQRLAKLAALGIMDTPAEPEFDAIVELASRLLGCPMSTITLIDDQRAWFKARQGFEHDGTPSEHSLCRHAMARHDLLVIEDASRDPAFADHPFVVGAPHVRFYAGAPLRPTLDGLPGGDAAIGALCVVDTQPRSFCEADRVLLRKLAGLVEGLIRARAIAAEAEKVSQQLRDNAALIDRKIRQLRQAERIASIGSWRLDIATGEVEWSDEVYAIHGLPVGAPPPIEEALDFYPEAERARIAALLGRTASHGEPYEFESDFITARGLMRRVRSLGEVELVDGKAVAVIGVFQDITERHGYEARLKLAANTDSLTGLPNRRLFEKRLADLQQAADQSGEPLAVLIIDLDGFKPVNDMLGHEVGDRVLRDMADRLRSPAFSQAFVARLGGDEFVMLVTRPRDCADLPGFVQSVLRELRTFVEEDGVRLAVTATVGATLFDRETALDADLLRQADLALYAAQDHPCRHGRLLRVGGAARRSRRCAAAGGGRLCRGARAWWRRRAMRRAPSGCDRRCPR